MIGRFPLRQFMKYEVVGALSTAADWGAFRLSTAAGGLHYQQAVAVSIACATLVNYTLNKFFTFRCASRRYLGQLAAHVAMSLIYLLASMGVMYLLVDSLGVGPMRARMATTFLLMFLSFAMHKYVVFNRRIFAQPDRGATSPAQAREAGE